MSRVVRRRLTAALQPSPAGWLHTTAVLQLPRADYPLWTPSGAYVEAMTATVWARRISRADAYVVVRTYGLDDTPVLLRGIVAAGDVVRLGGLTDKPHRMRWLGRDVTTETLGSDHPALAYHHWVMATQDRLQQRYSRLLRQRFLRGQQVRVNAVAAGRFQATVAIEVGAGAYLRHDLAAHAAALSSLLRHLGCGARLRFYPQHHPAVDPLDVHAWRCFCR